MRSESGGEAVVCLRVVLAVLSDYRGLGTGDLEAGGKLKAVCGSGTTYKVGWK